MSQAQAIKTSKAPAFVPLFNPVIRRLMGAGMPFGPNVLLTVRGRKSGIERTFPIAIMELEDRRFVASPYGEVNWVQNLRAAGEAVITKGRQGERVVAMELAPVDAGPILHAALSPFMRRRISASLAGRFFDVRRDSGPADYVEAASRHPMFELRPR